jgi:hypothetical protein
MRLMCWDMTIVHRPGTSLTSADYLSRLSADLCFYPFLKDYIQRVDALKRSNPAISSLPIKPENMPSYRAKRKSATSTADSETTSSVEPPVDTALINIASAIFVDDSHGHSDVLSNVPIQFGSFDSSINLSQVYAALPLYNSDLVFAARTITTFEWAVYSFNNGHFMSSIDRYQLPFRIVLAADAYSQGRALFKEFSKCPTILNGAKELYDHVRGSGNRSKLDGYLIHSHRFSHTASTRTFWQLQASILSNMRLI